MVGLGLFRVSRRLLPQAGGVLAALNLCAIGESLRRFVYLARHGCSAIGAGRTEDGKVLLCLIFNIYPIVPAAIPTLVMHIVTVDRSILRHPVAATRAAEIGVILICCHHTCAVALGIFHLDADGEGALGTMGKIGFIDHSAHKPTSLCRLTRRTGRCRGWRRCRPTADGALGHSEKTGKQASMSAPSSTPKLAMLLCPAKGESRSSVTG